MAFCNRLIVNRGEIFSGAGVGSRYARIPSANCCLALLRMISPFMCSPLLVPRGADDVKPLTVMILLLPQRASARGAEGQNRQGLGDCAQSPPAVRPQAGR